MFWYHDSRMINYGVGGVEVFNSIQNFIRFSKSYPLQVRVSSVKDSTVRSTLTVSTVNTKSSGNYTCQPSTVTTTNTIKTPVNIDEDSSLRNNVS